METKKIIYTGLALLSITSCSEEAPDAGLSISLDKTEYKVGEPVTFHIKGSADNIVFYSGEQGHEYDMRDRIYADNDLFVDIVTYTDYLSYVHPNLQCLVSTDFDGIYDAEHLHQATWSDISQEIGFATATGTNTPSNKISLKEYASAGNDATIYIAFRYFDKDNTAVRNRWVVRSINAEKVSPEGTSTTVGDMKTMGWQKISVSGASVWTITTSQLLAAGNVSTNDKDEWVVSKGIKIREAEPSTGTVLKNISTTLREYQYTYTEPGIYNVVFDSSSVWNNSSSYSQTAVQVVVTE